MSTTLSFNTANSAQASDIAALINHAFRSEPAGQTWLMDDYNTRTDMISTKDVKTIIGDPATPALVGTVAEYGKPLAVCLLKAHPSGSADKGTPARAWLGHLAVDTKHQRCGYGVATLRYAETFVKKQWGVSRLELNVVNARVELRAWYEKNGYQATGEVMEFPYHYHREGEMAEGLELIVLGKDL